MPVVHTEGCWLPLVCAFLKRVQQELVHGPAARRQAFHAARCVLDARGSLNPPLCGEAVRCVASQEHASEPTPAVQCTL
jgi:hypothetical protein